ncbi:MAG: hypothetical protein IPN48_02860 [Sphingomonadales bacterium]|nr:hypothetical protein [Sphingomonadales bacterium]
MRRYGETIAVTGLLTRSEKLGPIVTMDGGGWWSVWLNCFQARHIGHRVTIEDSAWAIMIWRRSA